MRPRKLVQVTISVATVLVWGSAWVLAAGQSAGQSGASPQQNPSASAQNPVAPAGSTATETPYPGSTTAQRAEGKEKHWSGTLVDVNCMAKQLSTGSDAPVQQPETAPASVPHFASEAPEPAPEGAQQRPAGGGGAMPESNPNTTPTPGTGNGADVSQADAAQMAKAQRIDNAAKQCSPSSSTQMFGLSMSGGQVVQFDRDGDAKAAEAIKQVSVQPGKKVKAKVTGTMENTTTVRVASVEVKGKHAS